MGFVGTSHGIEARVVPGLGWPLETVRAVGLVGRGWRGAAGFAAALPAGLAGSWRALGRMQPQVVLGVGGYASFPAALAALARGIPVAIQEQNSVPGKANVLLGRLAGRVFVSFPETVGLFPARKTVLTGNPVRREIARAASEPVRASEFQDGPFRLLVLGGSQGAHAINRAVVEALARPAKPAGSIRIRHQTGARDLEEVRAAYERAGIETEVAAFVDDMASAYREADLVLGRAGAATLAELAAMGKPSILVPYPHAAGAHQERNARSFEASGAAQVVLEKDLDPASLAQRIRRLAADRTGLAEMGRRALALARPDAAVRIVEELERLAAARRGRRGLLGRA